MFQLLSLCLILLSGYGGGAEAENSLHHHRDRGGTYHDHVAAEGGPSTPPADLKLFVFGDSFVDTGNTAKSQGSSWKPPYGITFPGRPSGRFSDGRVLTDFLASYLGLRSPVAYRLRNVASQSTRYGINFATGGTGVFDTPSAELNMGGQIDRFRGLLGQAYGSAELRSSVALVTLSGNDYATYLARNGSVEGLPAFIARVVNRLTANIRQIHELGVRRILVSNLAPLGCLPAITVSSSYRQCNGTLNVLVTYHNQLLQQAVALLNRHGSDDKLPAPSANFTLIDLFTSFSSSLNAKGNPKFENPLKPCCIGTSAGYSCGSVDGKTGEKKYSVCSNPKSAFFWDMYHPTQEGWRDVFANLRSTLQQFHKDTGN